MEIEAVEDTTADSLLLIARCRSCGYALRGLADARCPECGNGFHPNDPRTMRVGGWTNHPVIHSTIAIARSTWRRFGAFAIGAGAAWTLTFSLQGVLSLFFWTPLIYPLIKRRWVTAMCIVLTTPLAIEFFIACKDYARGTSRYVAGSMNITVPWANVNPHTRIRGHNPGCGCRAMNSWIPDAAETSAGWTMFHLIGSPPGAYDGPYPTEAQAMSAVANAPAIDPVILGTYPLKVLGFTVRHDLSWFLPHYQIDDAPLPPTYAVVRATLWRGRCLIISIPRLSDHKVRYDLHLIDVKREEMFALYWVQEP